MNRSFLKNSVLLLALLTPGIINAQGNLLMMSLNNSIPVLPSGAVTEFADTFTIGADADLNTHTTTTGGYAWALDAGTTGQILDISGDQQSNVQGRSKLSSVSR